MTRQQLRDKIESQQIQLSQQEAWLNGAIKRGEGNSELAENARQRIVIHKANIQELKNEYWK